jgi:hypothetical protein
MASGVSQHLGDVPRFELGDGQAVLVQHMMGEKVKGKGKSSSSSLFRPEDDTTEHARERDAEASGSDARLRDTAQDRKTRLEATLARQARGDHEELKEKAQPVAQSMARKTMAMMGNLFATAPSPTPQELWERERREAESLERQRKAEEREARSRERRRREELEHAKARAAYAPEPIRGISIYDISTPRPDSEPAPASRGRTITRQTQVTDFARSKSHDGGVSGTSQTSSGSSKRLKNT